MQKYDNQIEHMGMKRKVKKFRLENHYAKMKSLWNSNVFKQIEHYMIMPDYHFDNELREIRELHNEITSCFFD